MNNEVLLPSSFGEILKTVRKHKRLTQKQLAQQLGVHYNTISSWELGSYLPETRGLILELARLLDLNEQGTRLLLEASLTALSPHWNVPYQRNPFFTGRDEILSQLHDILHQEENAAFSQSCVLSGLGGIGKTQVVIEYAYRYANDYSAIFWVGSQSHESILSSFISIADVLSLPERNEQEQKRVVAAVIRWLNCHDQWLLIFDNVEDIGLVKSFLPAARRSFLLFTSRRQAFGISSRVLDLGPMTPEEGKQLLLRRARLLDVPASPGSFTVNDEATAREIVVGMDGLPLALDQAGSYIEATHCSLSDYLQLYRCSRLYLLDERDGHTDHPMSVTRTFALAFEQLERSNAQAAELLTVCAFLSSEAIPEAFFHEGAVHLGPTFEVMAADPFMFQSVIKASLMNSLLQRNMRNQTVTIHRLVQVVLRERLPKAVQRKWALRVIRAMSYLFPSEEMTQAHYWQDCERLLPHALACIALSEQWSDNEARHVTLMCHVASYLSERARYSEAESLLQRALSMGEQILGSEHPLVSETCYKLGMLYLRQGKYTEAEPLLQRALSIREQILGVDHPQVATSFNGLGMLYLRQGKYIEAESLYARALSIRERILGADHPQVAASLNELGILYVDQGKYIEAESLYARALSIRERILGADHPQVATLLNNLAELHREQGKYEQAEVLFQRALRIWEQRLGPDHPRVAYPLNNLALLYKEQGKYEQAEVLFQRALRIWEQRLGSDHFLVADPLDGLALLYKEQGKYKQAEAFFQRALHIKKHAFGPQHPAIADSLCHLACFHQVQQQTTEALSLYRQALTLYGLTLGSYHPKTRATRNAYIQLLRNLGRVDEASTI